MARLASPFSPGITSMIRMDHTRILSTFHQYKTGSNATAKQAVVEAASLALEIHTRLEEEIFYPAMRGTPVDSALVDKSVPEHEEMRRLIAELRAMNPRESGYDQAVMELMRDVIHHVADEETTLLPDAERLLPAQQLDDLGAQMTMRRLQLMAPHTGELAGNALRLAVQNKMVVAGALLAGTYLVKRAWAARHAQHAAKSEEILR